MVAASKCQPRDCFIQKLPHDVLEEIFFVFAISNQDKAFEEVRKLFLKPQRVRSEEISSIWDVITWSPIIFASVCRQWRQSCHNSAKIWSNICIPLVGGYFPECRARIACDIFRSIVASGGASLHIDFYVFDDPREKNDSDRANRILARDLVWAQSSRWESICILQSPYCSEDSWRAYPPKPPVKLRECHFSDTVFSTMNPIPVSYWPVKRFSLDTRADEMPCIPFFHMESLTHVEVDVYHHPRAVRQVRASLYQKILSMLSGSSSLSSLTIRIPDAIGAGRDAWDSSFYTFIGTPFVFPELKSLKLEGYDETAPSWIPFLRRTSVPLLRNFRLDQGEDSEFGQLLALWGFVITSFSMVRPDTQPYYRLELGLIQPEDDQSSST